MIFMFIPILPCSRFRSECCVLDGSCSLSFWFLCLFNPIRFPPIHIGSSACASITIQSPALPIFLRQNAAFESPTPFFYYRSRSVFLRPIYFARVSRSGAPPAKPVGKVSLPLPLDFVARQPAARDFLFRREAWRRPDLFFFYSQALLIFVRSLQFVSADGP
jgi:hypothetical protein